MTCTLLKIVNLASMCTLIALSSAVLCQTTTAVDPPGYFQQPYSIMRHVHLLRQGAGFHVEVIGNVTVIEQTDGLVLIDAGGSPGAGRRVVELVHSISSKPVKAIVITHWHGDHHFGLSEVLKAWPQARVISTESTKQNMNNRGLPIQPDTSFDAAQRANFDRLEEGFREQSRSAKSSSDRERLAKEAEEEHLYGQDFRGASIRYANTTFTQQMSLPDKQVPVELRYLGESHTDGDVIVWLPKQKVLVAGDAVVSPVPFWRTAYPLEWIGVLEKIRAFRYAVLIPGHGVPETNTVYIDQLIATLTDLNDQVRVFVNNGANLQATQQRVDVRSLARQLPSGALQYAPVDWNSVIACSYAEIKHIPIVQGKPCGEMKVVGNAH